MLTYDAHPFMQSICEVDQQSGEVHFVSGKVSMSILIRKGWQSHVKGGKPSGAYLSKGFTKYAFQVRSYAVICHVQNVEHTMDLIGTARFSKPCYIPVPTMPGLH